MIFIIYLIRILNDGFFVIGYGLLFYMFDKKFLFVVWFKDKIKVIIIFYLKLLLMEKIIFFDFKLDK